MDYESLRQNCEPTIWKGILLVRGFLSSGILIFALKHKYYRVDYGLALDRSLLAVPYRAKQDIPSLRAEFGHPDVAIVLTCLSYYYHGLTHQQLELCFELLFKLDNPSLEYDQWVKRNEPTSTSLKQLNGVNLKDRHQFTTELVVSFAHNSATIEFFLSSVVFPRGAKEFPGKLATSSWDLANRRPKVTTGFSGTNDNRYLLPASISQADPVKQLSTNALVLTYLLQPVNNFYVRMHDKIYKGGNLSTKGFLELLVAQKPEIRVLLDVGAQMLELPNQELVRCWLKLSPDTEAAVYFNEQDELVILPRNGTPTPFITSPFSQRLDKCIIYLDDGHTRGTDLKLPRDFRALVTLGPKVTKDRLLQGCMRMRKLGHGQSVVFAAPPEIDAQIRNASPTPIQPDALIDALDILRWAMLETCKDLQHHVSHWAQQGIEYARRHAAEKEYERTSDISVLRKGWTVPEAHTLEEMYGVPSPSALQTKESFIKRAYMIPELRKGLETLGVETLEDPSLDEEQEREVSHEIERQTEVQRPPKREAKVHTIHPGVERFINTGDLYKSQSGIVQLFSPFHTSHPQASSSWSRLLFASTDFFHTIDERSDNHLGDYMRPVNWVVSAGSLRVVLSPYEVNELLPIIRKSRTIQLHIYAPRVSLSMRSFSNLQFYSIPASPIPYINSGGLSRTQLQLDLFAGQLYLSDYQDYVMLCTTLGLFIPCDLTEDMKINVSSDGFFKPQHRGPLIQYHPEYADCNFLASPIPALKDLVGYRRKGMGYFLTHMGRILHGRRLTREDF
ncbi:Zinc finger protein Rlf [Rhizoctonia solani]|uniref:ubiquitinyl hydrolase 1 n=1 Tax=Rhizoctonia solani TaxID=456999 RepID=A0A0K6FN29_9AGAM|nr:Zinc finger protein Rlf [Rhizoctonia solani]